MLKTLFAEHPASVDETYFEHLGVALSFSINMFLGATVCLVHAFLPFLFVKTGSGIIRKLYERMVLSRNTHIAKSKDTASEGVAA